MQCQKFMKENQPSLECNKPLALSRFSYLDKKFEQNHKITNKYKETINDYVNKGQAVKLLQEKSKNVTPTTNYIPRHRIKNINKPEKRRVVFHGAAKFLNPSLNKTLLKDPEYLNSLVGILLRFHREKFVSWQISNNCIIK